MEDLERSLGYRFHDRKYLRRALTCQSAINEHHPQASNKNSDTLEFLGDAVLKYIITILVYNDSSLVQGLHDKVCGYIGNRNLAHIGRELNLERHLITGRGVSCITDKMLANAVEAILGAIVLDQQQQGKSPENVLSDVIARLFSIRSTVRLTVARPPENNTRRCSCCSCLCCALLILLLGIILTFFLADHFEL